jgi:hypothetical protein
VLKNTPCIILKHENNYKTWRKHETRRCIGNEKENRKGDISGIYYRGHVSPPSGYLEIVPEDFILEDIVGAFCGVVLSFSKTEETSSEQDGCD